MRKNRKFFLLTILSLILLYIYSCGGGDNSKSENVQDRIDIKNSYESKFTYDKQDRLKYEHYKGISDSRTIEYKYDNNGNILEVNIN